MADANLYDVNDVIEYDNDGVGRMVTDVNTTTDIITFANDALDANSITGIRIYNWGSSATDVDEDFHLDPDSPCINKGDPDGSYYNQTDIDGEPRLMGGRVDMGPDEVRIATIYVDAAASSNGDGLSWATAYNDFQAVLAVAGPGEQIWVAAETYKPTSGTDRTVSFNLKAGVALYGGFNGDETSLDERDWDNNKTILSGDIGTPGSIVDNSYHVVRGADGAVLDGFVIVGGNANGSSPHDRGGGMFNYTVSPIVRNCMFIGNYANYGGGVLNDSATPQIINCIFSGNHSSLDGGGMYNDEANLSILSCTFSQNETSNYGGAIYNQYSAPGVISCIIWGNTATTGPSIHNVGSDTDKPYVSYSDIQGCGGSEGWDPNFGTDGGGNMDSDPCFVDPNGSDGIPGTLDDNLHLQSGSPCIGTGIGGEDMGVNWPVDATLVTAPVAVTNPVDLVVDSNGNLYVLSSSQYQVRIYDEQLQLQDTIDVIATNPKGIAIDGDNNIYVADTGGDRILKYTSAGVLDTTFDDDGIVGQSGTGDGEFDEPWAIAVDFDGYIYVTDSNNNRVQILDPNGQFVEKWGQAGDENGQLSSPSGFCLFGTSEMFLADTDNYRIQHLSRSGYFHNKVGEEGTHGGQFNSPQDVCYDIDYSQVLVADSDNNRIQIFQLGGLTFVKEVKDIPGLDPAGLSSPMGVVCAPNEPDQIIYVADTDHNRVLKLKVQNYQPGSSPVHIFEAFKAALLADDVDKTLTFFADIMLEKYAIVLEELRSEFQVMADGMGELILVSSEANRARYDMLHDIGGGETAGFPVYFLKDENGNWKIYCF